jgi:hypothetical protein
MNLSSTVQVFTNLNTYDMYIKIEILNNILIFKIHMIWIVKLKFQIIYYFWF